MTCLQSVAFCGIPTVPTAPRKTIRQSFNQLPRRPRCFRGAQDQRRFKSTPFLPTLGGVLSFSLSACLAQNYVQATVFTPFGCNNSRPGLRLAPFLNAEQAAAMHPKWISFSFGRSLKSRLTQRLRVVIRRSRMVNTRRLLTPRTSINSINSLESWTFCEIIFYLF